MLVKFFRQKQAPEVFFLKRCSWKISQNVQENTCGRVSFLLKKLKKRDFIEKMTLVQVFFCKLQEIFKIALFT